MTSDSYAISDVPGQPCLVKVTGATSNKKGQLLCNCYIKMFKSLRTVKTQTISNHELY